MSLPLMFVSRPRNRLFLTPYLTKCRSRYDANVNLSNNVQEGSIPDNKRSIHSLADTLFPEPHHWGKRRCLPSWTFHSRVQQWSYAYSDYDFPQTSPRVLEMPICQRHSVGMHFHCCGWSILDSLLLQTALNWFRKTILYISRRHF